jgi:serine/threonine-protein kinase
MPAVTSATQIGPYVIERQLGRGAHGVVYRAHHRLRPDAPVALKVVESRGSMDRLLLEPAILSRLRHPGIVGIEDYFQEGDTLVLALEFIEGEDLKTLLDRGEVFSQAEVRELLIQVGSALAEAHAKNVIHRDLKPSNILVVRRDGRLRFVLTDFGIGQVNEGIQVRKHTGGTYYFMAPEQLRGRPCPQSDLWALGVVAYQLLTGRLPFPGPSLPELSNQIQYAAPPPPGQRADGPVAPRLERAVLRLLDKSLQERIASPEELLLLLGIQGSPSTVQTASPGRKVPKPVRQSLDRQLKRGIQRGRFWLVVCLVLYLLPQGLLAAVLLLVGMLLFYWAQTRTRWSWTTSSLAVLGALGLLAGQVSLRYFFPTWDYTPVNLVMLVTRDLGFLFPAAPWVPFLVLGLTYGIPLLIYLVLPVIAGAHYATLRRLEREKVLREVALEGSAVSDRYLRVLRDTLSSRFEDVGLHLKYAEALFARGQLKEAAVEARLILRQDRYHFNATLLLANAYLVLGLVEDCAAVCDRYLAVSGYCFELTELREQCHKRNAS